jgi:hypothetical protein
LSAVKPFSNAAIWIAEYVDSCYGCLDYEIVAWNQEQYSFHGVLPLSGQSIGLARILRAVGCDVKRKPGVILAANPALCFVAFMRVQISGVIA